MIVCVPYQIVKQEEINGLYEEESAKLAKRCIWQARTEQLIPVSLAGYHKLVVPIESTK